jgi:hypothetical protein
VAVPARPVNVATSWNDVLDVTLNAGYGAVSGTPIPALAIPLACVVKQDPYTPITVNTMSTTTVPATGGTVSILFSTNAPTISVNGAWDTDPASLLIDAQSSEDTHGVTIGTLPAGITIRTLTLSNAISGAVVTGVGPVIQTAARYVIRSGHGCPAVETPKGGNDWSNCKDGTWCDETGVLCAGTVPFATTFWHSANNSLNVNSITFDAANKYSSYSGSGSNVIGSKGAYTVCKIY